MAGSSILENRKNYKLNRVLDIIRAGDHVSRYTIKQMSSYSMTSVIAVIDELLADNLIYEEACSDSRVGRRPTWLHINPDGGYFIGVEFNAERMHSVVMNFAGEVVRKQTLQVQDVKKTDEVSAQIFEVVADNLAYIRRKYGADAKVYGAAIGVPGLIDSTFKAAAGYANIQTWQDQPLKTTIEERYHIPCYLENNVNVMAFAYRWKVPELTDYVLVSVRTGIRVVNVIDSNIVISKSGLSGELGHIRISDNGRLCTCGRYGCLQSEVSDTAIRDKIRSGLRIGKFRRILELAGGDPAAIEVPHYVEAVRQGDQDALDLMRVTASTLGDAIALLVNIMGPQLVVLAGQQMEIGDAFIDLVHQRVNHSIVIQNYRNLVIEKSKIGPEIGALGAAVMVMENEFSKMCVWDT